MLFIDLRAGTHMYIHAHTHMHMQLHTHAHAHTRWLNLTLMISYNCLQHVFTTIIGMLRPFALSSYIESI